MKKLNLKLKKKRTNFRPQIKSRHPSHALLRSELPLMPFRSVIRLGSVTGMDDTLSLGGTRLELNSTDAIKNSMSKHAMKVMFTDAGVLTADWYKFANIGQPNQILIKELDGGVIPDVKTILPLVAKHYFGSRGTGNYLLKTEEEFNAFVADRSKKGTLDKYLFERFHDYVREYRLHINADGCFYTCRKLLKEETPEGSRWFRNDSNSTWIVESNPSFDRPSNWNAIVSECVKALNAVGLDFGACDVKVQSAKTSKGKDRTDPKFFIIEINSAPSFGEITAQKYLEVLPTMLMKKYNVLKNPNTIIGERAIPPVV